MFTPTAFVRVCVVFAASAAALSWPAAVGGWMRLSRPAASLKAPTELPVALFAQPRRATDTVEIYLSSLPLTNATFPALRSADAEAWTAFFGILPRSVAVLTAAVRTLEDEQKTAEQRVESERRRAKAATTATQRATANLESANRALLRARQRSGGAASADTQTEEDRVDRAQEAQAAARSEEQSLLESVGRLERQRLEKEAELKETRTALLRATARIGPPQLGAIANRELRFGDHIVSVKNHTDVSESIGVAECEGAAPIILLAPRAPQPISNAAMMFFREHEMAHHVLRHIDCSRGQSVRSGGPEQEIQADCEAAKTLVMFPDGDRVVDIVFGHFWTWNQSGSVTHPSSRARASALFTLCK